MTYTLIHRKSSGGVDEAIWKGNHISVYVDGVEFGGVTKHDQSLGLLVHLDSFEDLAKAMMLANHEEAIKAFGAALSAGLPTIKLPHRTVYVDEIPGTGPKPGNPRTDRYLNGVLVES